MLPKESLEGQSGTVVGGAKDDRSEIDIRLWVLILDQTIEDSLQFMVWIRLLMLCWCSGRLNKVSLNLLTVIILNQLMNSSSRTD